MSTNEHTPFSIQTSPEPVPSMAAWFGEVTIVAHTLTRLGLLETLNEQVRFARKRFGTFEVIDFLVVLIGYAISNEPTLMRLTEFAEAQAESQPTSDQSSAEPSDRAPAVGACGSCGQPGGRGFCSPA
jgi:hypothetical protein